MNSEICKPDTALDRSAVSQRAKRGAAIVTGGRRGIGAAMAVRLAQSGFDVAILDVVEDEKSAATIDAIHREGGRGLFIQADISNISAHEDIIAQVVREFGPLSCLVNNAGVQVPVRGDLLDTSPEVFDHLVAINLRGTFFMTQAVARQMVCQDPGSVYRSIIVISSANATMASIEKGAYCVSKSALPMVAKLFATRLAEHEIDVFEIQPGLIRTDMTASVHESYGKAIDAGLSPNRRWGEAEDIGKVVATLASGNLPFSTGTMIPVAGGLNIHRL